MYSLSHTFFFTDTSPTDIYTLSLHDALPIFPTFYKRLNSGQKCFCTDAVRDFLDISDFLAQHDPHRSEEHTSELQSLTNLVCRLLLEKKKKKKKNIYMQLKHKVYNDC